MSWLDQPGPRWFSLAAHRPFLDDLAHGLFAALPDPDALAGALVLLPTRRGARQLAEALVRAAPAGAVGLPQIRALGDLEEGEPPFEPGDLALDLPPAIDPVRRRFLLTALVREEAPAALKRTVGVREAMGFADALGALLDSAAIEEADLPAGLKTLDARLATEGLAAHWQAGRSLLAAAAERWPETLRAEGVVDVAARRVALLKALAAQWTERAPERPLIAAGSTGTAPSTAALLRVIAGLPRGAVVLPALDLELADDAFALVDEQHPQGGMRRLLTGAGVTRAEVRVFPAPPGAAADGGRGRWRRRLISEAMRPAAATADWLEQIAALQGEGHAAGVDEVAEGLSGLTLLPAAHEEEAALAIALALREALEVPGRTAALVTPDQALARRVSAALSRFDVAADTSAGEPLARFPAAVLALETARLTAGGDPERALEAVGLLAVAKHPLVDLGWAFPPLLDARRTLERVALRGPSPRGWPDVRERLAKAAEPREGKEPPSDARLAQLAEAQRLADALTAALAPARAAFSDGVAAVPDAARGLAETLEALAGGPERLWRGPDGEALAGVLEVLIREGAPLGPVTPAQFAELLSDLLAAESIRAERAPHPRLAILGAIEARLVRRDLLILAGLEEGSWPALPPTDPFLSRPMRAALGLPPPERRLGLTAHDFAQAAAAPEVLLVTTGRREGAPTVESRWLWRLRTLLRGAGRELPVRHDLLAMARSLDAPRGPVVPAPRPAPTPPVDKRPRELPVTGVETWVRDPYAIYAGRILKLRALDPPDAEVEAMARGSAIHRAFEDFAAAEPRSADLFAELLIRRLGEAGIDEARLAREAALARRLGPEVMAFEVARGEVQRLAEQQGELTFAVGGAPFKVTARADRVEVDRRGQSVVAHVLDFKSGSPPSAKVVKAGFSPQLTLTAAIIAGGGFPGVQAGVGELLYVKVSGHGREPLKPEPRGSPPESETLAEEALERLRRLVAHYDNPAVGYGSWAAPQHMGKYGGPYDHLARVWEWHVIGADEGEAEADA